MPTGGMASAHCGNALRTSLMRMASATVDPGGSSSSRRHVASAPAWITSIRSTLRSFSIHLLGPLREGVDEAGRHTIEDGAHHRFERTTRKRVLQCEHHLAGVFRQFVELPPSGQFGKRTIYQMNGDLLGVIVVVAGREGLLQARDTDGDGRFHSFFIMSMHLGAATPGHEFRIASDVRHEIEHLLATVGYED